MSLDALGVRTFPDYAGSYGCRHSGWRLHQPIYYSLKPFLYMDFNRFVYQDCVFLQALPPSFAYGIGQGTHSQSRAFHPDTERSIVTVRGFPSN
jgi:hypothetical protein